MTSFTEGRALIVGVGEYQESHLNTPSIIADAQGIAAALKDPKVGAYPPDQVKLLTGREATREAVTKALRELAKQSQSSPDSTVFIFLSSHGDLGDDNNYYLITADTEAPPGRTVRQGTGVSALDLVELLQKIRSQKLLCIINTCFSGYVGVEVRGTLSRQQPKLGTPLPATLGPMLLSTGEGRVLITSSRPSQYSYYQPQGQHTCFGQALIDGLYGRKIADSGGYIGLYELYRHLYTQTKAAAAQFGLQEPVLTVLEGIGPFPVALYPESRAVLNKSAIEEHPPSNTAVEILERALIQAAWNQGGLLDLSYSKIASSNITINNNAGANIHTTTITHNPSSATDSTTPQVSYPPRAVGAIVQGTIIRLDIRQARLGLDLAAVLTGGAVVVGVLLAIRALLAPLVPAIILSIYQIVFALIQLFIMLVGFAIIISAVQPRWAPTLLSGLFGALFRLAGWLLVLPLTALAQLVRLPLPRQSRMVTYIELLVDTGAGTSARAVITTDVPPSGINYGDYVAVYGRRPLVGAVRADEIRVRAALTRSEIVVRRRGSWPWPVAIIAGLVVGAMALLPGVSATPLVSSPPAQSNTAATPALTVTSAAAHGSEPLTAVTAQGSQSLVTVVPSVLAATPVRRARVANVGGVALRVRHKPSTDALIAARLAEHTLVELVGEPQTIGNTTWQQIIYPDGMGWVDAHYLLQEP